MFDHHICPLRLNSQSIIRCNNSVKCYLFIIMAIRNILEIINLPSSAINFIGGQFEYLHDEGGYEMHLICSPGEGIEEFCRANKVKYQPALLKRQVSVYKDIKALYIICNYIKRNNIDVVIAHQSKGRLLGMLACLITGVRHRIIFAHGILYETSNGFKKKLLMLNDRFVSLVATKVVCVSSFVQKKRLEDRIDIPEKQVLLGRGSCNGIDTIKKFNPDLVNPIEVDNIKEKLGINASDFVIGFCGRLVKDKGIEELVEAFKKLKDYYPKKPLKLLIIGGSEVRDSLDSETLYYLKNSNEVVYTGIIPFEDIQKYYLLMNVLVLPSHREGFGMVAVEASAMGIPVVVSNYTGCAETIIPNETGIYVNKSSKSIIDALEKCFDKAYAQYLGNNGRKYVSENFEHTIIRTYVLDLIKTLNKKI